MSNIHVICPNCGTEFEYNNNNEVKVTNGPIPDGIYTLIPKNDKRINQLKDMGIDITKFFSSNPAASNNVSSPASDDEIVESIKSDGYVEGKQLFRRWIMAQMFRALSYEKGYDAYYKDHYPYQYSWDTTIREIKAQTKIKNVDELEQRKQFFNKDVVAGMIEDYIRRIKKLMKSKKRKCRGEEYVHIPYSGNYFVKELETAVEVAQRYKNAVKVSNNEKELLKLLTQFDQNKIRLSQNDTKGSTWRNAFIGAGAFYTLENLIKFHNVTIDGYDKEKSMEEVKRIATNKDKYPLFAVMKNVIAKSEYKYGGDFA